MAGRSAQAPELVEEWSDRLSRARIRLEKADAEKRRAEKEFRSTIRAAFKVGLSVTPIKAATGRSISRLYQINNGRRT